MERDIRSTPMQYDSLKPENRANQYHSDNWVHRHAGLRCKTCLWFAPKASDNLNEEMSPIGRCRRHAPTLGGYPVVYKSDWCGDHKVDENKI